MREEELYQMRQVELCGEVERSVPLLALGVDVRVTFLEEVTDDGHPDTRAR